MGAWPSTHHHALKTVAVTLLLLDASVQGGSLDFSIHSLGRFSGAYSVKQPPRDGEVGYLTPV